MKALIGGMLIVVCVLAATARQSGDEQRPEVWSVAGREVLRIRTTVGNMTPRKRVEMLDARLTEILSRVETPIGVADIEMHVQPKLVTITVCGDLLVTISQPDADANKTTPERLGKIWLSNIRKTVPLLSPRVNRGGA
jgi:hypothetical protein